MNHTYTNKITGKQETIELIEGDIIEMMTGISVEIGPNDTMRGLRNGQPDPRGWMPIQQQAAKDLAHKKMFGGK